MSGDALVDVMPLRVVVFAAYKPGSQAGLSRGTCAVDTSASILRAKEPAAREK